MQMCSRKSFKISFVLLFLNGFCGLFCHFQMTDFSPFLSWHIWTTYIELPLKFLLLCFTFPHWLLWSLLSFSDDGFFTFSLMAYMDDIHRTPVSNPVDLDVEIFFKAEVETQSNAPNLDLYPVRCYSSQSNNPDDTGANFTLISNG